MNDGEKIVLGLAVFHQYNLINLGFLQASSMQALWIKLKCTLEEMIGITSKETLESAAKKLNFTYYFTAIIIIASEACVVCLSIWGDTIYNKNTNNENMETDFKKIDAAILDCFGVVLGLYLLFAYCGLKMKIREIFGNELSKEFKMLQ